MVWFSILLAVTLQTCWLSPPVALSAYYLKGDHAAVGPRRHLQGDAALHGACNGSRCSILYFFPQIILVLPNMMFGTR